MGIAIHNLSASGGDHASSAELDLAAAIRQDARGLLGTSAMVSDLVRGVAFLIGRARSYSLCSSLLIFLFVDIYAPVAAPLPHFLLPRRAAVAVCGS